MIKYDNIELFFFFSLLCQNLRELMIKLKLYVN